MKAIQDIPKVECFIHGQWVSCPDIALLEPGDIIRMWDRKNNLPISIGGKTLAVVRQTPIIPNRAMTTKEYESVFHMSTRSPSSSASSTGSASSSQP